MSKISETVQGITYEWGNIDLQYGCLRLNTSGWKPTQLRQSKRHLERLLLDLLILKNILTQILEAGGKLGEAEENMLLEVMESTRLVVPNSSSDAQFLLDELEELTRKLTKEMHRTSSGIPKGCSPLT